MALQSINPKDGRLLKQYEPMSDRSLERALVAAERAFAAHKVTGFAARSACLQRLAEQLDAESGALGRMVTDEMGKTLDAAVAEIEKCAWVCRHYAEHAESMLAPSEPGSDAESSSLIHLPLGPVLAVMPWNFPFWQVFRFAAPAVMAGNVVLLKHASNVPRTALALQSLFEAAGFEPGVFQTLLIGPEPVDRLLADRRVKAATVTGSVGAGSSVAAIAGKHLKKTVLELGGSDPFIVMPSANLERALEMAVTARILNNGQSCIAAKRFILHADIHDAFAGEFVRRFEALTVGDPLDAGTDVGPLALARLRDRLQAQVRKLLDCGAERLTGARPVDGPGYFYTPGILSGIAPDAPAFDEELFGPVAWLRKVASFEDAIRCANETRYGLGSSLWTDDRNEMDRAALEIEAGALFVNAMVKSDPRLPFGGIKGSGYGRELARDGIVEFVNRKTIVIESGQPKS